MAAIELYFYEQEVKKTNEKRYRKLPEDLPESLRFAHLNPKVAAYLASKERQQKQDEDVRTDTGKKGILAEANLLLPQARTRIGSSLSNEEDSQKYLFEVTRASAASVLQQLACFLYSYENLVSIVPKSLEYQLMTSFKDLTADVVILPREWQTVEAKESYYSQVKESPSEDESNDGDGRSVKPGKENSVEQPKKVKRSVGSKAGQSEQSEDEKEIKQHAPLKRSDSRMSIMSPSKSKLDVRGSINKTSREHKGSVAGSTVGHSPNPKKGRDDPFSSIAETPSDLRSIGNVGQSSYYTVMQFQLSSKVCEDKGWIIQPGETEAGDESTVLEHCIQILQETMRAAKLQKTQDINQGYDKEVVLRYYADAKKDKIKKQPPDKDLPVHKGGKPKFPSMHHDHTEGRKLSLVTHIDGSTVAYYLSGRPSVIRSASGFGRPGFYTIVYEDGLDSKILACFTPSGKGVCYHTNGVVRFLATDKGGHLADKNGKIIRWWKWPLGAMKLSTPVNIQIHNNIGIRCSARSQMMLVFSCHKETSKFDISPVPGAVESKPGDENEQLLTSLTFSSRAAKDLRRIFAPKKQKPKPKKKPLKGPLSEIQKMFPEKVQYEIESDHDLIRLQRKARMLVEDWLEHYQIAIGFKLAGMTLLRESPGFTSRRRISQSAKLTQASVNLRRYNLGLDSMDMEKTRAPSAPAAPNNLLLSSDIQLLSDNGRNVLSHNVTFEKEDGGGDQSGPEISASTAALLHRLSESAGKRSYRSKTAGSSQSCSRQGAQSSFSARATLADRSHCPITVRQQFLGYEAPHCRCSRHYIPYIMDIEFDEFIQKEASDSQIIVISIVSSLYPNANNAEKMLDEIYRVQNRNRTRPCIQSRSDAYRILKYDINTASQGSDHTHPLLLIRHNIVPGMFLMYADGRLMFCDHIFNGYGNARKDFVKQIMKCRLDSIQGFCLPKDFRFSPGQGRSGPRSAWGGEIGGTGVDKYGSPGTSLDSALIPIHRSHSTSTCDSKEVALANVKGVDVAAKFISMSLNSTGFQNSEDYDHAISSSVTPAQTPVT
ncbi:hypothetical protein ScPMuIL_007600 [Solemya velum]